MTWESHDINNFFLMKWTTTLFNALCPQKNDCGITKLRFYQMSDLIIIIRDSYDKSHYFIKDLGDHIFSLN